MHSDAGGARAQIFVGAEFPAAAALDWQSLGCAGSIQPRDVKSTRVQ
jgi:hypothetical protein